MRVIGYYQTPYPSSSIWKPILSISILTCASLVNIRNAYANVLTSNPRIVSKHSFFQVHLNPLPHDQFTCVYPNLNLKQPFLVRFMIYPQVIQIRTLRKLIMPLDNPIGHHSCQYKIIVVIKSCPLEHILI
jgi:hypothetical protein